MMYPQSPRETVHRIESWQQRLAEVVDYVRPWTTGSGGMPLWVRHHPVIHELIEFMETRVQRLAKIVSQQQACPVNSWTIAYIEHELSELLDVARTFDGSLRDQQRDASVRTSLPYLECPAA